MMFLCQWTAQGNPQKPWVNQESEFTQETESRIPTQYRIGCLFHQGHLRISSQNSVTFQVLSVWAQSILGLKQTSELQTSLYHLRCLRWKQHLLIGTNSLLGRDLIPWNHPIMRFQCSPQQSSILPMSSLMSRLQEEQLTSLLQLQKSCSCLRRQVDPLIIRPKYSFVKSEDWAKKRQREA